MLSEAKPAMTAAPVSADSPLALDFVGAAFRPSLFAVYPELVEGRLARRGG